MPKIYCKMSCVCSWTSKDHAAHSCLAPALLTRREGEDFPLLLLQRIARRHSSGIKLMGAKHKPWTWFQRAQVGSAKSASAIQDSVRIFTSRLQPLSPCHVCLIQVGVPVGAAILGTTFTALAVSAAKRDQRRFEERSQREHAAEVCLLSRPVWSRRFLCRLSSDGCRNMLAE